MTPKYELPKRKDIRLKGYNYSSDGYYFVTICTHNKEPNLQRYKTTAERILFSLPERIIGLTVDYTSLMPTHLHTIFIFKGVQKSLGEVVRTLKALVSRETGKKEFWQRNYYEHVIKNENALLKIRQYIQNNPAIEKVRFEQFYEAGLINQAPTIIRTNTFNCRSGLDKSSPYNNPDKHI